ncbi:PilZ domain-containing protein [Halomonas sp. HP20-15]|uniref:PilZ domain-containing protein n=1 Tax=Halomonas sp. HP20-15 TaxID=3085901 RepID=UPI002981B529|nr:PilZ domain-containing protein [Halomonas sp. HP20-15]MDW5378193.1 PilZ domain-containing protein [Halomonas sp. HP20-15]
MSDDNTRDPNRREPTLDGTGNGYGTSHRDDRNSERHSPSASDEHDEQIARDDQLNHERRDERRHVRVDAPFQVRFADDTTLPGHDLSLGGFSIYSDRPIEEGKVVSASLLLVAGAAELIVPVDAKVLRDAGRRRDKQYEIAFEITRIARRHRELLRRVIRAHLSGNHASVESLVATEDPQTPRKRQSAALPSSKQPRQRKHFGRYAALVLAALLLVAVAASTAYRNFMLIEPDFAAVTAPRIDIRAPGSGILAQHKFSAGDQVQRDQELVRVKNSELQTDLILAKASLNYNNQLIKNLQERIDSPGTNQVYMPSGDSGPSNSAANFESVPAEVARVRINQFKTSRDYQSSRIDALESRMSTNTIYSPCNCLVAWARSSSGGTYINESERIMTLIQTGQNDVMVEALVHMDDIDRIEPHQTAYIALPNASEPIQAQVRTVSLDVERQPRAGFPKWVRQQQNVASVLLVPEKPLPASAVGVPVDVRFSEAPIIDNTVEWVWQGGRAVYQQAEQLFNQVFDTTDEQTATAAKTESAS